MLIAVGFVEVGRKGSHVKLRATRAGVVRTVILPHPKRDLPAGTFAAVLRQAGLTRPEFDQLT